MGYDMYVVAPEQADVEHTLKLSADFRQLCDERDAFTRGSPEFEAAQAKVHDAYERMHIEDRTYFRLNISGMGLARRLMDRFKMLVDADPGDPWPEPEHFGTTPEAVSDAGAWDLENEERANPPETMPEPVRQYLIAAEKHRAAHDGEEPGIPVHKLCSNDAWLVLPAEIEAALRIYADHTRDQVQAVIAEEAGSDYIEWWGRWLDWLMYAARHGGFRVH